MQSFGDKVAADATYVNTLEDLADGVFLSHVMHHIDPEYMNLALVNANTAGNWALKASNLKTLVRAIELFYHDELGQLCEAQEVIDVALVAKHDAPKEVAKLVELLLGCAVQCPSKSEYIHPIMQMDATEQASMMHTIEGLMHRFQLASPPPHTSQMHPPHRTSRDSLGFVTHDNESHESLQQQLVTALDKASAMELRALDVERAQRELTARLETELADKHTLLATHAALQDERDKLVSERQSTLMRDNHKIQQIVAGEIHALSVQLEDKNDELLRTKRESAERLMLLEHEVRRQADELDISRSKIAQLGKLEASVAKYKKKLDEMNALRTQVKDLETHNAQYLDKVLDLESTVKTIPALKGMVEKYKNQVVELETANVEVASTNQVKEQKIRRLQEELDSAMAGKEFLENQVDELRGHVANLEHQRRHQDDEDGEEMDAALAGDSSRRSTASGDNLIPGGYESMSRMASGGTSTQADFVLGNDSVASLRERVARLERENAELKRTGGGETGDASHLAHELDMAVKAKESLQGSLFELKQQNDQLVDELELLRQQQSGDGERAGASSPAVVRGRGGPGRASPSASPAKPGADKAAEYEEKIAALQAALEENASMRATVAQLTDKLKDKESMINDLSEKREKLENYTKKTLHAVQTKYMVAVSSHRNQLNEKQEKVDFLEKKMKETRASYAREQALMMSGFYEIGTEMQRRTMMPQTPGQGAQPAAWLASKRTEERAKRRQG